MALGPFEFAKNQIVIVFARVPEMILTYIQAAGTARPSFSSKCLEAVQASDGSGISPEDEDLVLWTMTVMFAGGADTVSQCTQRKHIFIQRRRCRTLSHSSSPWCCTQISSSALSARSTR